MTAVKPDYGQTYIEGLSIYGDLDVTRHLGVEAVYQNASLRTPLDIGENAYLIGPRIRATRGRFIPYAKFLFGEGIFNYQQGYNIRASSESHFMYAFGAGVDVRATRRINVRLFDFEYQRWPGYGPHGLTPYAVSVGAAYAF